MLAKRNVSQAQLASEKQVRDKIKQIKPELQLSPAIDPKLFLNSFAGSGNGNEHNLVRRRDELAKLVASTAHLKSVEFNSNFANSFL